MTSDMGETFKEMRERSKIKRASNRQSSAALLTEKGVKFEEKNVGAHLIVRHAGKVIDFWPGTGLWHDRAGWKGRGVMKLLKRLRAT